MNTKLLKSKSGIRLDIGCGASKQGPEWVGLDIQPFPGVEVVHDWNTFPWPLPKDSVLTAVASHVIEHVNPANGHFIDWMNEVWRVLKPDGQFAMVFPYGGTQGYWQDPTHCNGCNEATWFYFDPLHESHFYNFYEPAPWAIEKNMVNTLGIGEVLLRKRRDDMTYHINGKVKYA